MSLCVSRNCTTVNSRSHWNGVPVINEFWMCHVVSCFISYIILLYTTSPESIHLCQCRTLAGYYKWCGGVDTWPLLFVPFALPIVQFLSVCTFPESPKWLYQQGRYDEARKALERLRMTKDVRADILLMKGGVLKNKSVVALNTGLNCQYICPSVCI